MVTSPIPSRVRPLRRLWLPVLALGLLALGLLAGCGMADDADTSLADVDRSFAEPDEPAMEAEEAMDAVDDAPAEAPAAHDGQPMPPVAAAADTRQVIRTAHLVLEVLDGAEVADAVQTIAERAGGFLAAADLRRDQDGLVTGQLVVRVPNDELLATVDAIDELGEAVPVRRVDEQDVTTELVDLDARLANLRAYEDELRDLLGEIRGDDVDTGRLLAVFDQLNQVRLDIETIDARRSALRDQVALSTVTVELVPAGTALPVVDSSWQPGQTVRDATAALLRGLSRVVDVLIWLVITVLPIVLVGLLLLAVVVVPLRLWWRRQRARRPAPAPVGPPPPTGSPTSGPASPPSGPPTGSPTSGPASPPSGPAAAGALGADAYGADAPDTEAPATDTPAREAD